MNSRNRVGWGSRRNLIIFLIFFAIGIVLGAVLGLALSAQPAHAQEEIPEPPPPAVVFTGLFFNDDNGDGRKQAEEAMTPGVGLSWQYTDTNGLSIAAPANSDEKGEFVTNMDDCPCSWKMQTIDDHRTWTGRAEIWSGPIYVPVPMRIVLAIKAWLPVIFK
jgi:hypothetical protein